MHTVLLVEADDHALRTRGDELLLDGYEVVTAQSGKAARLRLAEGAADVLVLGALERPAECLAVLRELRQGEIAGADSWIPLLVIGTDAPDTATRFYEAGADNVLPASPPPLLVSAALRSVIARASGERHRLLRVGPIRIDSNARTAAVDEKPLVLSRLEFDLLETLARHPGSALSRRQIAKLVWHNENLVGRTIDAHAMRLRSKLGSAGVLLQSVRGVGYRLGR